MGSSRLPGKVLRRLGDATVLEQMVRRVTLAKAGSFCAVLTTTSPDDDAIVAACQAMDVPCFRGHPTDCLDRHFKAGVYFGADAVVKIPSDCPLIDPRIIDRVVEAFGDAGRGLDYAGNLHPPSYPDGNDVEVMAFSALETAWAESVDPVEREHTTPFLWRRPSRFRLGHVAWETGLDLSESHRLTLDYPEDLELIRRIHEALSPRGPDYSLDDILGFLARNPGVHRINESRRGDFWYRRQAFASGVIA